MAREFLMLHREDYFGRPYLSTGAPRTSWYHYVRLDQPNSFTMRPRRRTEVIPRGGGMPHPAIKVGVPVDCGGSLRTILHYSQAADLLGWCVTPIPANRAAPWGTIVQSPETQPVGDLASMAIYHAVEDYSGTVKRRVYKGVKVSRWSLAGSAQSPLVILSMDLIAQKPVSNDDLGGADSSDPTGTEFPAPAETAYPTDPVLFQQLGTVTLGAAQTRVSSIGLEGTNMLDARHHFGRFLTYANFRGRTVRTSARLDLGGMTDREAFEAITAHAVSFNFTNGVTNVAFDMQDTNYIGEVTDDLQLERNFDYDATWETFWDVSAGNDITVTVS
jgi:hypothetical protein